MPSSTSFPASRSDAPETARLVLDAHGLTGPAGDPVIHEVDLQVSAGARVLVLGPIESGKSMLMRHVLGLERAERGTVSIDGEAFDPTIPDDDRLRTVRTRLGAVFERPALLRDITVLENVELPLLEHRRASPSAARQRARALLQEVRSSGSATALPDDLDRAAQRRVALARAMALDPVLLLLDEPTIGLDPDASHAFDTSVDALQQQRGFGLVIFSREIRYAFRGVHEIVVMSVGAVIARGSLPELMESSVPLVRRMLHRRGAP